MPDNKHTPGSPDLQNSESQNEPALTELISSAMNSINGTKKNKADETEDKPEAEVPATQKENASEEKNAKSDVPDITFKKADQSAPEESSAAKKTTEPQSREKASEKPDSEKNAKPKTAASSAGEKKKPAAKSNPSAAQTKKNIKKNSSGKPDTKPKSSLPAKNTSADSKPSAANAKAANAKAAKVKFTKKQAATVGGLILSLLLVLVLVVVLIFNHYYNLMDTDSIADSVNSAEMVYSDVDLSRADTIDKDEEAEKLKELSQEGEKISNSDVMNILLIGEDLRDTEDEDAAGNTDVMMIISVNTKDKTITMTSIMRDCYVSYQDANGYWYSNRINAAYWTGGISLTQQTIENYLNVKIDRYVLVNFRVFIDIVDTLGGLDLYVSDEEANGYADADPNGTNTRGMQNPLDEQNKYLGNKKGTDYIKKGGNLHLNGNQALAYARLRYIGNSDYERTERQRKVITEMIKKSRDLSIIEMDKLANTILPQIKTDVTKSEAAQLLIDMLDYRNYEIQEFRVPADGTFTDQIIDGKDVLSVDFNTNADMFRELVYGTVELDENGEEEVPTIE